jgi:hypothetical protein
MKPSKGYNTVLRHCKENNLTLNTTPEDFSVNGKLSFTCHGETRHTFDLKYTSYNNQIHKSGGITCAVCKTDKRRVELFNTQRLAILEKTGHKLIRFIPDTARGIEYECGECGLLRTSSFKNLINKKSTRFCSGCLQTQNRKPYSELLNEVAKHGMTLITTEQEYISNKSITVTCNCGELWVAALNDIKRGRKCKNCKQERTVITNNVKYGVDNTFQYQEFKEKIIETNMNRLGVSYPQQNNAINLKTQTTCLKNLGVRFAFCQQYVYEMIRKIHFEKYGVEFPLQSEEIQRKCMQNPETFRKVMASSFRRREYVSTNSGEIWMILGYEDVCLRHLEETESKDTEIYAGDDSRIPHFDYYIGDEKKRHVYYPDIYIPSQRRIIEVKSIWVYNKDACKNLHKALAVSKTYNFELWIYDTKKQLHVFLLMVNGIVEVCTRDDFELGKEI